MPGHPDIPEYKQVLESVKHWKVEWRLALVRDILQGLSSERRRTRRLGATWQKARGLLRTERPVPSDEEVRDWLEEHRLEKHG